MRGRVLPAVCFVVLLITGGGASASAATETHVFDPALSLTGDCSVSELDPVRDPGPCPGTSGIDHPNTPFKSPAAVVTDSYGDIYVANEGSELDGGPEGRIDIFGPKGHFITQIVDSMGPSSLAIDSDGNLYVTHRFTDQQRMVVRYSPTLYKPEEEEIGYGNPPSTIIEGSASILMGLAVNPLNNHLLVKFETRIKEYKAAAEGNSFIEEIAAGGELSGDGVGIAVDAAHGRLYASTDSVDGHVIKVFELASPHAPLFTIKPPVKTSSYLSIAADEGNGHVFIYDGPAKKVYEFEISNSGATYVKSIEHGFQYVFGSQIGIDNGENSPNGALNPTERYFYVPSDPGKGHSFAFGPPSEGPPKIESSSFSNVGETEAELQASIEPFGLKTHYTFQYLAQQQFEDNGETFSGIPVAGEGEIRAGNSPVDVVAAVEGLEPGTRYRFRVFAENSEGSDETEVDFATFPAAEPPSPCANDPLRTGFSALLPDCRAYELVTPPDTNARAPHGLGHLGAYFATREASPAGDKASFQIEGGIIPGSEGTGGLIGDPYLSTRGGGGWDTSITGPNGLESTGVLPGSTSPDQGYSFWNTGGNGSAAIEGKSTSYIRYPDGHSVLVGHGSLATDPRAVGKLISENGGHIVFTSGGINPAVQLEPDAPPNGTAAVYDRTADEVTHVVSLLPGDETPAAGQDATYEGASLDGKGIAFRIGNKLYLRYENDETYELGEGVTFAGVAEGGARAFYLQAGKLWRFDAPSEERTEFSSVSVTPVNVAANGTTAYFISQSVLTGEPNPNGAVAKGGEENLYRSEEGAISFVCTVTERDVEGASNGSEQVEGLGLWTEAVGVAAAGNAGRLAEDPSRTTPDGNALLFESRANLDGYDPEGHAEIYRYDFAGNELDCLSCNPTLAPASNDASLQSISAGQGDPEPLSSFNLAGNLRPDGNRAFFQSTEALVPGDVDGLQDVYEWEAQGTGSCARSAGCIYLISSGHSLRTDYLYAASDSGDDVFFRTSDILLPRDAEETPSIYDARVEGGFPEPVEEPCEGEGCRPGVTPGAVLPTPGMLPSKESGNLPPSRCPKGKRKVNHNGKTVCVKRKKKHHKKHHRKKAGKSRGTGK